METHILLNALAMGSMTSPEIGLLINSVTDDEYEKLSEVMCGVKIPNELVKDTLTRVLAHQTSMSQACGRQISIKAAAMDYMELTQVSVKPGTMSMSELSRMALHDDLTGVANFRYFDRKMTDEVNRSKRYKHVMSLIMVDIDKFKMINDKHGHAFGNHMLQLLVTSINECIRDTDFVARYGGEEFAIILPETNKKEAFDIAERIRNAVKSKQYEGISMTASFGVATFGRDTFDKEHLVSQADQALYTSKKAGRDRTTGFDGGNYPGAYKEFSANFTGRCQLVGSFNKWTPEEMPQGKLRIWLASGTYQYKFILGDRHVEDPLVSERVEDGYGGKNSVLVI